MRVKKTKDGLSVRAIAGAHVVILAMDMKASDCKGLLGFAIHRTDHTVECSGWLEGKKTFKETDPKLAAGFKVSSRQHPFQDFTWSDYTATEGHNYTYRIVALKGSPTDLRPVADVSLTISTESAEGGDHDVYFNRGAASSQEYTRRFGNRKPGSKGGDEDPAWKWLSRGAHEAMLAFIGRATKGWGLRVCAYEFRLPSVAEALKQASKRGANVKIIYDGSKDFPAVENREVVKNAGLKALCTERVPQPMAIPHNKFIVLLKGKKPVAVLSGSTNFSAGGVFGQSNVVHIVDDGKVAGDYLKYWELLVDNPAKVDLAPELTATHALAKGKSPKGTSTVFSPRSQLDALEYYFALATAAKDALFMSFPFGMHDGFKKAYKEGKSSLRYALLDKLLGPGIPAPKKKGESEKAAAARKKKERETAIQVMTDLREMVENRFAVGSTMPLNLFDKWTREQLTGLNEHVQYIHTKYMIIDPLSDDPIVVSGSANFSAASSTKNDENMLVVRGNARVADIYLGEYMRLWDHYAFREWATARAKEREHTGDTTPLSDEPWHLKIDDSWWKRYFGDGAYSRLKQYLVG
jgi:phosphatidylserine/phosphatidylglycerophosphate/cardiolipin synthase-like enzyme